MVGLQIFPDQRITVLGDGLNPKSTFLDDQAITEEVLYTDDQARWQKIQAHTSLGVSQ
jgi:hypothetical protein